jgi:flagellar biosynthesis chaperone FliJ
MDGGTDGILGLGILPKPGQFSLAEISNIRLLIKADTLQHLLEIDRNLPKGAELTTMFSDIKSIRSLLTQDTITRIKSLTYGKQDGDLTLNRILKVIADDGRVPTYYAGQNLGTGIYTSLTTLSALKNDIIDVANFYKANRLSIQNLLKMDFSKIPINFTNINNMLKGLVTDDSYGFRLRLNNMKSLIYDTSIKPLQNITNMSMKMRGILDDAVNQLKKIRSNISDSAEKIEYIFSNRAIYTYTGYDIDSIGGCHYYDNGVTYAGIEAYLDGILDKIKGRVIEHRGGGGGCPTGSYYLDGVLTAGVAMYNIIPVFKNSLTSLRNTINNIKESLRVLVGEAKFTLKDGTTLSSSDGMIGALSQQMFNIENEITNLRTRIENISNEVDMLRKEIKDIFDKFQLR